MGRLFRTVVFAVAIALVAVACGGSESNGDTTTTTSTSTPSTTSTTSTTAAPTTTTTTIPQAPTDPAELAEFVQLKSDDLPDTYEYMVEENDTDEICVGTAGVTAAHPPEAELKVTFDGDQIVSSNVAVYATDAQALAAFEYLESAFAGCDGALSLANDVETLMTTSTFAPTSIDGTDRLAGLRIEYAASDFGLAADANLVTVGPIMFLTISSDPAIVNDMARVIVDRAEGVDQPAEIVPEGELVLLPGYGSSEYYSWPEGPAQIRESTEFVSAGAAGWVQASSDDRLDEIASVACVDMFGLSLDTTADELDTLVASRFTDEELLEYGLEELAEAYGLGLGLYCPAAFDNLLAVLDAQAA